jgi:hypothetical protein
MALPQVVLPTYELEIPSNGKTIKVRPFVVKEEKLLLLAMETEEVKQIEDAVKQLLKGCIQSRVKIDDLAIFDLEYIFLQIRAVSVGEVVDMNITCEDDGKTVVPYKLNLTDVQVQKPEGHSNKIMLSDEMGIIMKYPRFDTFITGSIIGQSPTADFVVDSSTTNKKEFKEFLENLTNNQFEKIQKFFESSPRLEHTIKITNPNTGVENEVVFTGLSSFFG